ncbi:MULTISPECIES: PTS sugar transporter subunit IIA [Listeria]|uniref:PTS sugar transporter subunit IIA n=3 Tax=Listeria seeligeri TaxID=1640 RepID=A0A7X0X240_LISSE|nr:MULTISPECIES: PTS sugar transporter subunit IIA [Listeria]AHI55007.1 PTS fructose transporter subunit IIA [Listeria ivanovii WSLC3009]AIS64463.1 PTS sugar transporter subunit IIA [Listeria ivanovii subsp. ivanovii]EFS01208.1 PTS system, IIA component [Listeria seeligeri FSL N1-067]KKD44981.1 PTS sugar transporter subunit IIA [Listeria seeligeri]MBC1442887.1 PTS sugar transporter subunit IIA [Listeria seeligeri]
MDVLEYFKEEMVLFSNEQDKENLLSEMAEQLIQVGAVKPSFKEAVIKREAVFPTGLLTAHAGVAIPHTDSEHVIRPVIAVRILETPVSFIEMASDNEAIEVKVVFMMALKSADEQLDMLQTLIQLIQDEEVMTTLLEAKETTNVLTAIEQFSRNT